MTEYDFPAPPRTPEETGLRENLLLDLTSKILHAGGTMTPAEISNVIKLPRLVVRALIKTMVTLALVEAQGLEKAEDVKSDIRYSLTDKGLARALDALVSSKYVGAAPVTLEAFDAQIRKQSLNHERLHRTELEQALTHLVFPDDILAQIGPASNSSRSVLLYGDAGNGKTSIAEALGNAFEDRIFFPHAVSVGNQIIQFFDETLHETDDFDDARNRDLDQRWLRCRRPFVLTGGELTVAMLDLAYDPIAGFYEAPMHLKALGGVFVLDDFGRQREEPREFLDRWIVPLDKGYDILSLHSGRKFRVPFDQLVVFSTNRQPEELGDTAALRRIYFKIFVPSPTQSDYLKIFRDACAQRDLAFDEQMMTEFFRDKYVAAGKAPSGSHPGFLLDHVLAACAYLDLEPRITRELLDLSWRNVATDRA